MVPADRAEPSRQMCGVRGALPAAAFERSALLYEDRPLSRENRRILPPFVGLLFDQTEEKQSRMFHSAGETLKCKITTRK